MASQSFSDLIAQAEAEGTSFDTHPEGEFNGVILNVRSDQTQNGKHRVGVQWRTDAGTLWDNIIFSPENPKAVSMFLLNLKNYGIEKDFLAGIDTDETGFATIADAISKTKEGQPATVTVKHRRNRQNPENPWVDIKKVTFIGGEAPPVAAESAPVAAPAEDAASVDRPW